MSFTPLRSCRYVAVPLEEKQVDVVVLLGEEVAEDTGGVSTADLIGWQAEVNALDKVPQLSHKVLIEHPAKREETQERLLSKLTEPPIRSHWLFSPVFDVTFQWRQAGWRTSTSGFQTPGSPTGRGRQREDDYWMHIGTLAEMNRRWISQHPHKHCRPLC